MRRIALLLLLAGCDYGDLERPPEAPAFSRENLCTTLANQQEHGWQIDFYLACLNGHATPSDGGVQSVATPHMPP